MTIVRRRSPCRWAALPARWRCPRACYSWDKVGAFNGPLITANLLTSIAVDHFGWIGMKQVRAGPPRLLGAALMVGGIVLISVS